MALEQGSNLGCDGVTLLRLQNNLRRCLLDTFKKAFNKLKSKPYRNSTLNNKAFKDLKGAVPQRFHKEPKVRHSMLGSWLLSNGMNPTRFTENPHVFWIFVCIMKLLPGKTKSNRENTK